MNVRFPCEVQRRFEYYVEDKIMQWFLYKNFANSITGFRKNRKNNQFQTRIHSFYSVFETSIDFQTRTSKDGNWVEQLTIFNKEVWSFSPISVLNFDLGG